MKLKKLLYSFLLILLFNNLFADNNRKAELLQLLKKYNIDNRNDTVKANVLRKLYYECRYSNPLEALDYIKKARELYVSLGDVLDEANTYNLSGNIYFSLEMYYLAMEDYFKCYKMEESQKQYTAVAYSLIDIANTYYAQKIYDVPLQYYKKAVKIFKDANHRFGLSVAYNNIALVKRNTGQLDSAIYYFKLGLDIRKTLNDPAIVAHDLNYIGVIYFKKGDYSQSLDYFNQSIKILTSDELKTISDISKKEQIINILGDAYECIGDNYTEQIKNQKAKVKSQELFELSNGNYQKALNLYQSGQLKMDEAKCYLQIGKLFLQQDKYKEAVKDFLNALNIASANKFINEKRESYLWLYKAHKDNPTEAIKYLYKYSSLSDSLEDKRLVNKLNEVHAAIETLNKEKENDLLRQKNAFIKRLSLSVIFFLCSILLFAVYFVYTRRRMEKRWHQLSNATFEGILIIEDGIIIDGNNKVEEILNCDRKNYIGKSIFDFTPKDKWDFVHDKLTEHLSHFDTEILRADGKIIPAEVISRPFEFRSKPVRVASLRDITERLSNEATLKENAEKLKELNATKDKFFSIIAHDLKNPFSAILGFSEFLINELKEGNKEHVEEFIALINETARKAFELLENLLEWSRSQTGRLPFNPLNLRINSVIREQILFYQNIAQHKSVNLNYEESKEICVLADINLVKLIIRNLISNAVKFTDKNGTVTIKTVEVNDFIHILIQDTGRGINEMDKSKLFRIDISTTTIGTSGEKGTGLGLILCKEFVEKNGGKIWVESEQGKGSTFGFSLPKAQKNTLCK